MKIEEKILNDKNIEQIIRKEIKDALTNNIINSFSSAHSTRSSKRSDELHLALQIIAQKIFTPSSLSKNKIEINIDSNKSATQIPAALGKSKSYSVDLLVKQNLKNKVAVEIAAPMSSLNKNYDNNQNKLIGRARRVFTHKENIQNNLEFYQVDFLPNIAPVFDKSGNVLKFEEVYIEDLENNPDYDPSLILPLLERQKVTNIIYEVNPEIYNLKFKTKKELYDKMKSMDREEIITKIDISNIVDFYNSIGSLIRK